MTLPHGSLRSSCGFTRARNSARRLVRLRIGSLVEQLLALFGHALRILFLVPENRDKRRRSDLDLFILALIDSGVSTPYELQRAAGLSQGATVPVLRRLHERGMLLAGKAGQRGRTAHRLTAAGLQLLKDGWKELIADGPSCDIDSDLRVALIVLLVGGNRRVAVDFLRRSAAWKLESLKIALPAEPPVLIPPLAYQYRQLRAQSARALIMAEAAAMSALAKSLPRKPTGDKKSPKKSRS